MMAWTAAHYLMMPGALLLLRCWIFDPMWSPPPRPELPMRTQWRRMAQATTDHLPLRERSARVQRGCRHADRCTVVSPGNMQLSLDHTHSL